MVSCQECWTTTKQSGRKLFLRASCNLVPVPSHVYLRVDAAKVVEVLEEEPQAIGHGAWLDLSGYT